MNAKYRDKDIVCDSERCRGERMRGKDKHSAKNTSPPYEFSSIGRDDVCWNKAGSLLLLFHYSLSFVYSIYSEPQESNRLEWVAGNWERTKVHNRPTESKLWQTT